MEKWKETRRGEGGGTFFFLAVQIRLNAINKRTHSSSPSSHHALFFFVVLGLWSLDLKGSVFTYTAICMSVYHNQLPFGMFFDSALHFTHIIGIAYGSRQQNSPQPKTEV